MFCLSVALLSLAASALSRPDPSSNVFRQSTTSYPLEERQVSGPGQSSRQLSKRHLQQRSNKLVKRIGVPAPELLSPPDDETQANVTSTSLASTTLASTNSLSSKLAPTLAKSSNESSTTPSSFNPESSAVSVSDDSASTEKRPTSDGTDAPLNAAQQYASKFGNVEKGPKDTKLTSGVDIWSVRDPSRKDLSASDYGYFISVKIGSEDSEFLLQIDTGSADTWVPSQTCTDCGDHAVLDDSETLVVDEDSPPWSVDYSSANLWSLNGSIATVTGFMAQDSFKFGGGTSLEKFTFGLATSVSAQLGADYIPYLGVFGLANSNVNPLISKQNIQAPILSFYDAAKLSTPQIGLALGKSAGGSNTGLLTLGGVAPSQYSGELDIMDNLSYEGYWEAPATTIGLKQTGSTVSGRSGIIDSRTALIQAPQADIIALFSGAKNACELNRHWIDHIAESTDFDLSTGLVLDCQSDFRLEITVDKNMYYLQGPDLIFAPLTGADAKICGAKTCCLSTVQVAPDDLLLSTTQWIFGTPFLRNVYLGLDYKYNRIGLAYRTDNQEA